MASQIGNSSMVASSSMLGHLQHACHIMMRFSAAKARAAKRLIKYCLLMYLCVNCWICRKFLGGVPKLGQAVLRAY